MVSKKALPRPLRDLPRFALHGVGAAQTTDHLTIHDVVVVLIVDPVHDVPQIFLGDDPGRVFDFREIQWPGKVAKRFFAVI